MLMISTQPQRETGAGEGKEALGGAAPGNSGRLPTHRRTAGQDFEVYEEYELRSLQ